MSVFCLLLSSYLALFKQNRYVIKTVIETMDKNAFGTYEYLPSNNAGMDTDEFLVVQDDGTFLLNRQVQYVAQVQDVKEALDSSQACTVYDVTAQQFYVDVTDNSSELISVADNYILPDPLRASDETDNLYDNSFLLQVVSNESSEQTEKNLPTKPKEKCLQDDVVKKENDCTEITLTDEQYKTLEQKGYVLLEGHNRLFILDSYGLHEISANSDLIANLKGSALDVDTSVIKKDNDAQLTEIEKTEPSLEIAKSLPIEYESIGNNIEPSLASREEASIISKETTCDVPSVVLSKPETTFSFQEKKEAVNSTIRENTNKQSRTGKILKIKTKHCFKDIPDRIVLGKTANGKELIAKVVKRTPAKGALDKFSQLNSTEKLGEPNKPELPLHLIKESSKKADDSQFETLVQRVLQSSTDCSPEQVSAAHEIVAQLFYVPSIQSSVAGRNVVITKDVDKSKRNRKTSVVTGIVTANEDGTCNFTHMPELLQSLITKYIEHKTFESTEQTKALDLTILHVNVSESKYENNVETISVVLNEHVLPCEALTKKPLIHKFHACSSCATIFQSESELEEHQETHVMEAEDTLTIDTDKIFLAMYSGNPLYVEQTTKGMEYACYQCPMKFTKLNNYSIHVQTHGDSQTLQGRDSENESGITNRKKPLYRCKMCNCSYFYPSTLAKHISTVHIKSKVVFINDKLTSTNKN